MLCPPPMPATPLYAEATRDALRRACASLDLAELTGNPFAMSQALAEVARCYCDLGAETSAEPYLEAAVRWARASGSTDHLAELLCELANVAVRVAVELDLQGAEAPESGTCGHAARERARDHAFEVSQLVARISDAHCEARLLLRASEVLERCGDLADARQLQVRALNRLGGVAPRDAAQLSGLGRLADL